MDSGIVHMVGTFLHDIDADFADSMLIQSH
jgi:hypothetical protein